MEIAIYRLTRYCMDLNNRVHCTLYTVHCTVNSVNCTMTVYTSVRPSSMLFDQI